MSELPPRVLGLDWGTKRIGVAAAQVAKFADAFERMSAATTEMAEVMNGPMAEAARGFAATAAEAKDSQLKAVGALQESSRAARAATEILSEIIIAAAFLIGGALAWLIGRGIVRPVNGMTEAMGRLAGGDRSVEVPGRARGDELGAMAASVEIFKQNMIETDRLRSEQAEMQKRAEAEQRQVMANLADDFERAVGGIVRAVSEAASGMQTAAETMSSMPSPSRAIAAPRCRAEKSSMSLGRSAKAGISWPRIGCFRRRSAATCSAA